MFLYTGGHIFGKNLASVEGILCDSNSLKSNFISDNLTSLERACFLEFKNVKFYHSTKPVTRVIGI